MIPAPAYRPTLLVWGENDPLVPPAVGDLLRREIPGSRLLLLRGAAHVPMFDRPAEFDAALLAFLAAAGPPRVPSCLQTNGGPE